MSKIISLKSISAINNQQSAISNQIVLVTGCFDVLHQAHQDFLKAAKNQGDLLIVGLEVDKRVRHLKGPGRPINKLSVRLKNLLIISEIDYLFPLPEKFNHEKDYLHLLELIKPSILAISEHDQFLTQKKKLIEKVGGKLFVFPFDNKYSTTTIISKLKCQMSIRQLADKC